VWWTVLTWLVATRQVLSVPVHSYHVLSLTLSQKFGGNENIDLRRDALHSARCLSVRVSVRPSHAGILSKRLNISCNFFSPLDSRTILVFLIPNSMAILRRDPPSDGVECMGCVKKLFFGYRFMSEITQGTDIVTMECE